MAILLKLSAAALVASAVCLLLKKSNPEMGLALSVLVCAGAFALVAGLLSPVMEILEAARKLSGLSEALFYPVIKAVGIGIWVKLSSDVCRDSGQGAMAGCMEIAGAICALYVALPLMETLLDMLEDLV